MSQLIRVFLADDHAVVRSGTRLIINSEPDMKVVGEAADGDEMLRVAQQIEFDVALVDVNMPRLNGLRAAAQLRAILPQVRILILTGYNTPTYMQVAQEMGVDGFMLKERSPLELITSIRMLAMGHQVFPKSTQRDRAARAPLVRPTEREQEIIKLVASGYSNKEIATRLVITERTVEYHLSNLYSKMGVASRAEAVKQASDMGWLIEI